jgi:hypothetical protein
MQANTNLKTLLDNSQEEGRNLEGKSLGLCKVQRWKTGLWLVAAVLEWMNTTR